MRRTKLQRDLHRRVTEEWLVEGRSAGQIVRSLVANFGLTSRQARYDLAQVQAAWRREDDELRQNRWRRRDLAIAADRCERDFRAALAAGDPRRAMRVEKHRSKLLGLYEADRRRAPHVPQGEREAMIRQIESDLDGMYAEAPRNPDGSVVLTAYSRTPPPVNDERYREKIERPLARGPSRRREERIGELRAALAAGVRIDQLEAAARERYRLSPRQVRSDVRLLVWQLEDDGHRLHQGIHDWQLLPLALRRRERIAEMARRPKESPTPVRRISNPSQDAGHDVNPSESKDVRANEEQPGVTGPDRQSPQVAERVTHSRRAAASAKPSTKATKPDERLVADVEADRCKLLGLYARERPNAEDDDLHGRPHEASPDGGRMGSPSYEDGGAENSSCSSERPREATGRADYDNDRMTEIELAFLDAQNGYRHALAEMLPNLVGGPGHAGR